MMTSQGITSGKITRQQSQFVDEEVSSESGYLSGYQPRNIFTQVQELRNIFRGIGYPNIDLFKAIEKGEVALPTGAEGWFAIPHWSKVGNTYQDALEKVLALLRKAYGGRFKNFREGELEPQYLRETSKKARAMKRLQQSQDADIILVPAQFGIRHCGRSVRRARAVMGGSEFGLGAYEIGIMLLTHPDRLKHYDDLWVDSSGDEYSPVAGGLFEYALCVWFDGDRLKFDYRGADDANGHCGSTSGFFPTYRFLDF